MVTAVQVAACTAGERAELLRRLDEEFIFSRGRRLGVEARFPEAMRAPQSVFLCARTAERGIVGGLLLRPFDWTGGGQAHRGAMIGLVWTDNECRGQGIGSQMMAAAAAAARQAGCEFALLWTARPAFYARLGWLSADCGMLGVLRRAASPDFTEERHQERDHNDALRLASMAASVSGYRVNASCLRFDTLLPPATERDVLIEGDSYALVGRLDDTGYVLEFGGAPSGQPQIWATLRARYRLLYLNVRRGDAAHRLLAVDPAVRWQAQQLTMWLPLTDVARTFRYGEWYVPFPDRI